MSVNVDYINTFIEATEELFATMLTIKVAREKPYLKNDQVGTHYISGIIGMAGEASGSVVLSFPEQLSIDIVSDFLGEKLDSVDQNVKDGIGELANIVAGGAKKRLSDKNYAFKISIPTVVVGEKHQIARPKNVPCIVVPFKAANNEAFALEVTLKKS